jgi:lipoate---protein ligase
MIIWSPSNKTGFNLAAEEYLFFQRQDEILFLYINEPCVVVGCNQSIFSEADTAYCVTREIGLYRRLSGGGAVFQDNGNLNFCIIRNRKEGQFALGTDFLNPIVNVLHQLAVPVSVGPRKDLWLPDGHKVTGTASHIGKTRLLHHGTLLYDVNLTDLNKSLTPLSVRAKKGTVASVPSPVKNIREYLSEQHLNHPESFSFFSMVYQRLAALMEPSGMGVFTEDDICRIHQIKREKYDEPLWTFKK